jgi:AAA ATPase domain
VRACGGRRRLSRRNSGQRNRGVDCILWEAFEPGPFIPLGAFEVRNMKLINVHVTNFKSVEDSEEFSVDQVTCLVGKNEAGKSAILLALVPTISGARVGQTWEDSVSRTDDSGY